MSRTSAYESMENTVVYLKYVGGLAAVLWIITGIAHAISRGFGVTTETIDDVGAFGFVGHLTSTGFGVISLISTGMVLLTITALCLHMLRYLCTPATKEEKEWKRGYDEAVEATAQELNRLDPTGKWW